MSAREAYPMWSHSADFGPVRRIRSSGAGIAVSGAPECPHAKPIRIDPICTIFGPSGRIRSFGAGIPVSGAPEFPHAKPVRIDPMWTIFGPGGRNRRFGAGILPSIVRIHAFPAAIRRSIVRIHTFTRENYPPKLTDTASLGV